MPRASLDNVVESILGDDRGGRFLDMRLNLTREATGEVLLKAGGRWDRAEKRFTGRAKERRVLGLHEGQVDAARWFVSWMAARKAGRHVLENGQPVFAWALVGGRRGGKSVLALRAQLAYLDDIPRSIGWFVVPAFPDMAEAVREVEDQIPREWYRYRENEWKLENGSKLFIRSSHDPDDLKRGRVDVAVLNEAQKHDRKAYGILRPAVADKGGLVILTANPPDSARGEWLSELVEKSRAGKVGVKVFDLDPRRNPHVDYAALEGLKNELDERTYRREILGEFLPREDVVFYAYSDSEIDGNVRPEGTDAHGRPLRNVTEDFLARSFSVRAAQLHGMDFQKTPGQAASTMRFYEDPDEPNGPPLIWYVDSVFVERGSEDHLLDALEGVRHGYTGDDPVVIDASGEYQDSERTKGKASADVLRRRGWRHIFLPDPKARRNPHVSERIAVMNGLWCSSTGKRRAFVVPECGELRRAFRLWEYRNGKPSDNRTLPFAHYCDASSYPPFRLFPRRIDPPRASRAVTLIARPKRGGWESLP